MQLKFWKSSATPPQVQEVDEDNPYPVQMPLGAKDGGPAWTPLRVNKSSNNLTVASDLTADPPAGETVIVDDLWISTDTDMRVDILEEGTGTVVWSAYAGALSPIQYTPRSGLRMDTADAKARIQTSAAGNIRVTGHYHSEVV